MPCESLVPGAGPYVTPGVLIGCLSALGAMVLPYIHIGIVHSMFWVPNKPEVDRLQCKCDCFDTIFKGSYMKPGSAGYMHLYFNATGNTLKIWIMTGAGLILLYEGFKQILQLSAKKQIRVFWVGMFVVGIYPNYYGYWNLFNYYNEDFFRMFNQQVFFSLTELAMSGVVLGLCDKDREISALQLLTVFTISLVHIIVGVVDQFFLHLIRGQGQRFLKNRDFSLLTPDIVLLAVSSYMLVRLHRKEVLKQRTLVVLGSVVILGTLIGRTL